MQKEPAIQIPKRQSLAQMSDIEILQNAELLKRVRQLLELAETEEKKKEMFSLSQIEMDRSDSVIH